MVIEKGLSDYQMSATDIKVYYTKQKPFMVHCRKFENFCNNSFLEDIELLLSNLCIQPQRISEYNPSQTCTIKKKMC